MKDRICEADQHRLNLWRHTRLVDASSHERYVRRLSDAEIAIYAWHPGNVPLDQPMILRLSIVTPNYALGLSDRAGAKQVILG